MFWKHPNQHEVLYEVLYFTSYYIILVYYHRIVTTSHLPHGKVCTPWCTSRVNQWGKGQLSTSPSSPVLFKLPEDFLSLCHCDFVSKMGKINIILSWKRSQSRWLKKPEWVRQNLLTGLQAAVIYSDSPNGNTAGFCLLIFKHWSRMTLFSFLSWIKTQYSH